MFVNKKENFLWYFFILKLWCYARCVEIKTLFSYLKRHRESFVTPPVGRQHRAQKVWAVGSHELGRVVRDDLHHGPVVVLSESRQRRVRLLMRIVHLPRHRLKAAGRRTEPAAGARIYRNAHHNNVSKGEDTSDRHLRLFLLNRAWMSV